MRIVNIFPRLKTLSGAEIFFLSLVEAVQRSGHEMVVLTRRVAEECTPLLPESSCIHQSSKLRFLVNNHLLDAGFDVLGGLELGGLAPEHEPDVVCVHAPAILGLLGYKWLRRGKRPCLYYCYQPPEFVYTHTREVMHGYRPWSYLLFCVIPFYRWLDRFCVRRADGLLCFSTDFQQRCRRIYGRQDVVVVPPGVAQHMIKEPSVAVLRQQLGLGSAQPVLLTVNKLIPKKNIELFIRLVARLQKEFPALRGVIVGDGPLRAELERLVDQEALRESISFTGLLPRHEDVWRYFRACDLHLFLERNMPFGMTPLEAGVQERATFAFRGGGTQDTIIDGQTGVLSDPDADISTLQNAIRQLLHHPEHLHTLGVNAAKHAARFSLRSSADRFVTELERIATQAR